MKFSLMSACKEFFGLKPDQRAMEFGKELFALTNEDRREIAEGLAELGFDIESETIEKKSA